MAVGPNHDYGLAVCISKVDLTRNSVGVLVVWVVYNNHVGLCEQPIVLIYSRILDTPCDPFR